MVKIRGIWEKMTPSDGARFLVESEWPEGLHRNSANIKGWLKELAPSDGLKKWYRHDPLKAAEFRDRYIRELKKRAKETAVLARAASEGPVTLLYGTKHADPFVINVLKEWVEDTLASHPAFSKKRVKTVRQTGSGVCPPPAKMKNRMETKRSKLMAAK